MEVCDGLEKEKEAWVRWGLAMRFVFLSPCENDTIFEQFNCSKIGKAKIEHLLLIE